MRAQAPAKPASVLPTTPAGLLARAEKMAESYQTLVSHYELHIANQQTELAEAVTARAFWLAEVRRLRREADEAGEMMERAG